MCFLSKHQRKWSISVFTSCVFDPLSARIHFLKSWLKFQLHFQVIKQETWLVGCISMISSCLGKEVQLDVNIFLWLMKINLKLKMRKRVGDMEAVHLRDWGLYYFAENWYPQSCFNSSYTKIRLHSGRKKKKRIQNIISSKWSWARCTDKKTPSNLYSHQEANRSHSERRPLLVLGQPSWYVGKCGVWLSLKVRFTEGLLRLLSILF